MKEELLSKLEEASEDTLFFILRNELSREEAIKIIMGFNEDRMECVLENL